ncbi:hypothetical protein IFM89_032078 [Coptis chinensis]|uniref:Uncharacterized protein n=1 Tax=Coptis chinensis TaxID=261450 RepID=A0A835M268_9MAGN|nr:hypothetical protein IFM89_032078 [Coptis chinensis]
MELVIASSSVDSGGISCFDLQTGAEQSRFKSCSSPSHGLLSIGGRFLASSQLRDSSASSGSILYWSWNKLQAEVRSFPAEPISPLVSNREGTYIIGGGSRGDIYYWDVASGRLLNKWHAHYRAVTCLVLSDDESLLISGSEDGSVRVWSLYKLFNVIEIQKAKQPYEHSFSEHTLRVTDVVCGSGGCSAIVISASEDRTCKVWGISEGRLLRTVEFPSIIDAIALDPGEKSFFAGSRDGKIYIAALDGERTSSSSFGMHIIGALSEHSKAVSCLALNMDGNLLVSGLVDGTIRVWDTKTLQIVRMLKHSKGPVNNVLVIRRSLSKNPQTAANRQASRRHESSLPPPLDKYTNSKDDDIDVNPIISLPSHCTETPDGRLYYTSHVMSSHIKEFQQQGSSAASEMEMARLRLDSKRSLEMTHQWMKMYEDLHHFCVDELVDGDQNKRM